MSPTFLPQYRKKFAQGKAVAYMFLPQAEPACNSRCTGCYVLSSEAYARRARRTENEVISDLEGLTAMGYSVIISTTEILLNEKYAEMLKAAGSEYVLTNGRLIVLNPAILEQLSKAGIRQVVVTANFGNSGIRLTGREFFRKAAGLISQAGLSLMVRITLTQQNFASAEAMVSECNQMGIRTIEFLRFMPLEKGPATLTEGDTLEFFRSLDQIRAKYPDVYISASGSLGSQFRRRKFVCNAGKSPLVIGLDNGIYPCIYLTQNENRLGTYENGELRLEREFEVGGNQFDCPAYRYFTSRSTREKQNGVI